MAFVEALNKLLAEQLFKVQNVQELNDPEKVLPTYLSICMDWQTNLMTKKPR